MQKRWMVFSLVMAFAAGCAADTPAQPSGAAGKAPATTAPAQAAKISTQDEDRKAMDATVPANFSEYATAAAGDNRRCVVGASVDDDGLNQRPVLLLSEQGKERVLWSETLPLPPDTYQGRATHCFGAGGSLYVLIQSDTQSEQTLSQTLLRVINVDPGNGTVIASMGIEPAGVTEAHSAWVEEGQENFRLLNGRLVVTGMYYRLADAEDRKPFRVELNSTLKQ